MINDGKGGSKGPPFSRPTSGVTGSNWSSKRYMPEQPRGCPCIHGTGPPDPCRAPLRFYYSGLPTQPLYSPGWRFFAPGRNGA